MPSVSNETAIRRWTGSQCCVWLVVGRRSGSPSDGADEQRQEALDGLSRHAFEAGLYDRNKFPEDGQDV